MEVPDQLVWAAAPACLPECSLLLPDLSLAQVPSLSLELLPQCMAWAPLLPHSLLAGVGWEENLAQHVWKLAALAGRRGRKGDCLLALWGRESSA